ncbi:fumarylacetoacetate hydrolase family protein (plasmid) [Sphingomonas aliaeris]|uniref:Fumarylacetoacetate hydrolase family protein n=1 Tax=Sphingomonas aliaeris TaxID=2759526 RepID=A0A974NZ19_9SPHN|nr:fumarylacetoacetate hydrolase family protein [Sphingomonas aliaeris]QQV79431.1 fumarylacetoacetate hydrolase family protein [Sphingomonas aliaeris]
MRLATQRDGTPDGRLLVVARDGASAALARVGTLQAALDRWTEVEAELRTLAEAVEVGEAPGQAALDVSTLAAPLPRAWQWLDGSAYPEHGRLMQQAFDLPAIETDRPLMYQGMSDQFLGALDDVPLPSEADGIDFEGELGVIVDAVPMGVTPMQALEHIRLVVQINDWSLRAIAPVEMKTGFGWVQAKPACSVAPFAVTPTVLGDAWRDGRVAATLAIDLNGKRFGAVDGAEEMAFGFHELIAHAARTRRLCAGTIVGSGTLSTSRHAAVGSSCLSEGRAIDVISGRSPTPFMRFGDRVRMEARVGDWPAFGIIDQRVVPA